MEDCGCLRYLASDTIQSSGPMTCWWPDRSANSRTSDAGGVGQKEKKSDIFPKNKLKRLQLWIAYDILAKNQSSVLSWNELESNKNSASRKCFDLLAFLGNVNLAIPYNKDENNKFKIIFSLSLAVWEVCFVSLGLIFWPDQQWTSLYFLILRCQYLLPSHFVP